MSLKDRTSEFHSAVESIRTRSISQAGGFKARNNLEHRRPLLDNHSNSNGKIINGTNGLNKSEFARMAGAIGNDINITATKLQKLTKLAKRKTLFDDRPVEISVSLLQQYVRDHKKNNTQANEHSSNVVVMLQSKLANTSMSFKDVLEIRTQNMKASKDRREQFMFSNNQQANITEANSPLYNTQKRNEQNNKDFLALDMSTGQSQQLQLMERQDNYIESRATAIESIESTIAELGNIFQQLAQMVSEQRETVQRIDANTDDIQMHVEGAQKELLKYYASISSNHSNNDDEYEIDSNYLPDSLDENYDQKILKLGEITLNMTVPYIGKSTTIYYQKYSLSENLEKELVKSIQDKNDILVLEVLKENSINLQIIYKMK
ncbi:9162_t:CDS:10 [Diversispora eburnea]|uniref:9162_t:CDS:1 n=1 Tax=Diversispora eburnea TaxID=1213867 RepID=A0A9N8YPQ5_9GLOM|nr:9162_t:CDS:10 [Diversispora eburnea]